MAKTALKINYPDFEVESVIDPEFKKDLDKITHDHLTESNTARTIRNIRKNISATIKANYGIADKEQLTKITDGLLKIHGLHEDNFDFMKNFEDGVKDTSIVDHTIDANANKNEKVMVGYLNEVLNPGKKLIGMDMLYRTMKDLYGRKEAKKLTGEMYSLSLGLSDSTSILVPYCWALDASKLVTVGRDFGVLPSKPCKRVSSYISSLCETIHQMSAHLAGAIAIGTFFLDLAHICIYKERRTLDELKNDKRFRKYVENELQQFIHSVNHLSRNGVESPFTNVSIFDSIKLKMLIGEDNYGWYFENHKAISTDNDLKDKMSNEQFQQYVIDYIMELQNLYMDFFEKGDPLNNGLPYRFPVSTVNFSKSDELKIEDDKFIKAFCKRDVSRFNIFGSKGTKIASCCRLCNNGELLEVASQVNSFGGGGSVSMGSHRVCTINFQRIALECNSIDDYYNILRTRVEEAAKILRAHKLLILKLTEQGFESFISNGYINPNRLFSTFGMLGIYEAKKTLQQRFDISNDVDITNEILVRFNQWVNEISKQYGIIGNIEQIPGETFAVRLAKADQLIYSYGDDYYKLYANQFCPLYEDFSLFEKLESDGKYNQLLTGGGIVHIQVTSDTTPQQNEALIRKACSVGCEHFAINKVFSKCKKCGHVVNYKETTCHECGSEEFAYMTRVVGFFTPVDSWNKTRREWEFPRRHFTDMSVLKQS